MLSLSGILRNLAIRRGFVPDIPAGCGRVIAIAALSLLSAFAGTVAAKGVPSPKGTPDETQLQSHGHYRNRSGVEVHAPSASRSGGVPAGASAHCRDGTYSFSQHRSGTCSGHHGVAEWE